MCDLFQANPWKPLLCTNCHQNRSGHHNLDITERKCEHIMEEKSSDLPTSSSTMHLYEEIMAQYFTLNTTDDHQSLQSTSVIEQIPTSNENIIDDDADDDSFSDEEQEFRRQSTVEFVPNQSVINTQGIVLIGPELRSKQETTKKSKKMNLLRKSKSNAGECLKKSDIMDTTTSKLWWFKLKKHNTSQNESTNETNKPNISSPMPTSPNQQTQRVRVLPEISKLTLNEALSIARRQHPLPNREAKLTINSKPFISLPISTGQSIYGSSIASTTSSSTHSSNEYDSHLLNNANMRESTYLTAVSPAEKSQSLTNTSDKTIKLTIERLTFDLRVIIDEYKQNLPVAHFQTLKSFLHQNQLSKVLSNEMIYFLLLQIMDELHHNSATLTTYDHFLIAHHSTIPIIVTTTSSITNEQQSIEPFVKTLTSQLFDSTSSPSFNDLSGLETIAYQYLSGQIFQFTNADMETNNQSTQRIKLLNLFWNKVQSIRHIQINEENERFVFALYYLMRYISQSDS